MQPFMDKDFMLNTEAARTLYHEYAENMPIVDYHCHINPQEIYEDRKFENITQRRTTARCRSDKGMKLPIRRGSLRSPW